jgi:uncharacterized protein YacL
MSENIKKIISSINGLHTLSRRIIVYGVQIATGGLIISLIMMFVNRYIYNYDYLLNSNTLSLAKTCVILFAEAIIGGLVIDYFIKKKDN